MGIYFLDTLFSDMDSLILEADVHMKVNGYNRLLSKPFPDAVYLLNRWGYMSILFLNMMQTKAFFALNAAVDLRKFSKPAR